ncbi:site-specific integrase [Amycolatopsis carbonis]|uniref:Site-specific integrase n=1 Tax=Amycolatopsis carbonis TaxID=715471 RepID=A0A9Y2IP81_9PSEU|nr:site-specific integrase [Amycolatopsis sp. 2-15]WIX82876.1 site-specific integrase [Amycolatopsis sp. 2-15]
MAKRSSGRVFKRCGCVNPADGRRWGLRCPRLSERGHGRWYFTVELAAGRDGGRRRLQRGGFVSRVAAERARGFWLGDDVDPGRALVTVGQWLDVWLATRTALRPSTRGLYGQLIRDYLQPRVGGLALSELSVGKVQAAFTALMRANATRSRPLSPTTLQRIREVLRAALNGAIRRGLIVHNPARWVELPSARRPRAMVWTEARVEQWRRTGERPPVAVWTAEQTAMFLEHVCDHQLYALFHVAALLGLRRGEALGLRWCDVDLASRTLSVVRQLIERDGRGVCLPKTDASCRLVALDRGTVSLLRRLARRDPAGDWVFSHDHGRPWSPSYVSRSFRALVDEAGLPPIRFHDLRHGAATLSLAAGNELRVVQALLGHSSIVLTADTYTSVLPCLAQQAADATAALVRRAGYHRGARIHEVVVPRQRSGSPRARLVAVGN